jgi:hypothetical protein
MTAINDLVTMAGDLRQELALPMTVLADLEVTMRELYGSVFDIFEGVMGIQPVIIPYTTPAPVDFKESSPAKEVEKKPTTVGRIDIRTLLADLQSALNREIPAPSAAHPPGKAGSLPAGKERPVRKTTSSSVTTETFNVNTITKEIQKHIESLEKQTISLPNVYSNFYGGADVSTPVTVDRSFAVEYARASPSIGREVKTIETADNKHVRPPSPGKVKAGAAKTPASPPAGESVRRSTTAVKALETVYENIVKNSVSLGSIDREIKTSSTGRLDVVIPAAEKGLQLRSQDHILPPSRSDIPAPPKARRQMESRTDRVNNIEVPALKIRPYVPSPSVQAEDNARNLSDAFSKSVSTVRLQGPDVERSPAPANTGRPSLPLSTLASVYNSFSVMGSYMGAVADMARPINVMANAGARSPVVNLALERAIGKPDSRPSPINVLRRMGGSIRAPIPEMLRRVSAGDPGGMRLSVVGSLGGDSGTRGQRDPAVNLAFNMAEMQRAGGSVIQQFIRSGPSVSSGLGGAASAVAGERNSIVNISSPAAAGNTTDNSTVNRVSNFHNTFNITISTKGAGEESSLRDLGKKMGRILSDEMKRYGGI